MMRKPIVAVFAAVLFATANTAVAAPSLPAKDVRCAVCGMLVAPFPQWLSALETNDGRFFYFDGPKDLFVAFFDLPAHLHGVTAEQIAGIYVTEYYTLQMVSAKEVFFVTGSNVMGPMGQELVPVAGRDAAETFKRDHAGQKLMRFDGRQLSEVGTQP